MSGKGALESGSIGHKGGQACQKVSGVQQQHAGEYGQLVPNIDDADLAILRLRAPYQLRKGNLLELEFHAGDLDFKAEERNHILSILKAIPTIVDIYLDRPAVIPEIAKQTAGLLADFGASDAALLDVVFGRFPPVGRLPFELPSSMDAVRKQKEDVPYDSENPVFPYGHGLDF